MNLIKYPYKVKNLPYTTTSLEPIIDKSTLLIHHDKIYVNYVEKLNLLIKEHKELENYNIEQLIYNPFLIPPTILNKVLYYAGGIYNHELYFENLSFDKTTINGTFKELIILKYKTYEEYKNTILNIAASPLNYHWIITSIDSNKRIQTIGLKDNDTSIPLNLYPLLVIDIEEHAYFLKYHNHKDHYVSNILNIINYDVINERIKKILKN